MNSGENFYDTTIRETFEECNIDIRNGKIIRDLGQFKYLKSKDLYLYLVVIDFEVNTRCNSFFVDERKGIKVPEMVDFKWIKFDDYRQYFGTKMSNVFDKVIPTVKLYINK